jgi:multidrug efflux system membrane fusion protein
MKQILIALSLSAALAAACSKQQEAAPETPPVVKGAKVAAVTPSALEDYYEAVGTVRSQTTIVLSAKIMGSVTALHAREGDRVRAGQIVIEIDNRDAVAQLQKAQAGLNEAQQALAEVEQAVGAAQAARAAAEANQRLAAATYARYQTLLERRSVSPQEFDEVKARHQVAEAEADRAARMLHTLAAKKNQMLAKIEQAKADIANAQVYLSYARLAAPIHGLVIARQTEVGSIAAPGAPLLTIEDGARYRLEAAVEESQIGKIRLKDAARVRIDALGPEELAGSVAEIVPAADPASRSYTVKINLPSSKAEPALRSGLYGTARFITGQRTALTIPHKAIVQRGQLAGVYVVDESSVAHLRLIKTGKAYGDQVEVLAGLNEGERIVVEAVAAVRDGSRVQ